MKTNKGQSTLEYVLLVTAVLVVIIGWVAGPASPFKQAVNNTLYDASNQIESMSQRIMAGK
jgi:uncharacterized protein (UPF0333 family)